MHTRLLHHIRHNVVAYIALFIALGGSSYAVVNLPANSVGPRQLRNHTITPVKLDPKSIAGSVRAWVDVDGGSRRACGWAVKQRGQGATTSTGETVKWVHQRFASELRCRPHTAHLGARPGWAR